MVKTCFCVSSISPWPCDQDPTNSAIQDLDDLPLPWVPGTTLGLQQDMGVEPKVGGCKTPKMDVENKGKPYFQMDDLGVPLFLQTPISPHETFHPFVKKSHSES